MCQRVMIALALACSPALLVADEPTTGLDVTTQAAIMDLIRELALRTNMATLLITHDLALAAEHCDRIVVMHAGHVVEVAPAAVVFEAPRHPYTAQARGRDARTARSASTDLAAIPGGLPDLRGELPPCRYRFRCERYAPICDGPAAARGRAARPHGGLLEAAVSLLEVRGLERRFPVGRGWLHAVDDVSLEIGARGMRGARRGVGLRQVHPGPAHHAPARPERRHASPSTAATSAACRPRASPARRSAR